MPAAELNAGDRVKLTRAVERYPHFVVPAGAVGTVEYNDLAELHPELAVKLDNPVPGMEEWDSVLHFYDPADAIESLTTIGGER